MSDEIHLQAALRHAEHSAMLPWQARSPDEELMAKEDGEAEPPRRAWLQEVLLTFLFADGDPRRRESVSLRALAIFRHCLPGMLAGRDLSEVEKLAAKSGQLRRGFRMEELVALCVDEEWREIMEKIMVYLFPARKRWLFKGTQRAYLLAKAYQPQLVSIEKWVKVNGARKRRRVDLSYEDMSEIFDGKKLETEVEGARARARWSAMTQALLRKPIEAAGGTVRLQFGKSAGARAAMAKSAQGNHNRKGEKKN